LNVLANCDAIGFGRRVPSLHDVTLIFLKSGSECLFQTVKHLNCYLMALSNSKH